MASLDEQRSERKRFLRPYVAPDWMASQLRVPSHRVALCHLPTPIEALDRPLPGVATNAGAHVAVKRDDLTGGVEMTGNKTRKLEFLLADAINNDCDVIVTTGGQQSNHCRATCAAAQKVHLPTSMILRDDGHGDNGNLFIGAVLGATQTVVPRPVWQANGGHAGYLEKGCATATAQGLKPCAVPCGGSNRIGVFGYLQCCEEMVQQGALNDVTHVVCTSGSGGTVAGLAIGIALLRHANVLKRDVAVVSYCVCDTPDEFYDIVDGLIADIALPDSFAATLKARDIVTLRDAVGEGYGKTTLDERKFLVETARATGIVFDRTYTNKAVRALAIDLANGTLPTNKAAAGASSQPARVLFVHTGGAPSVFDHHDVLKDAL